MEGDIVNGRYQKIIISGGHIEFHNGSAEEIVLLNGATLGETNGAIGQIG